MSKSNSDRKEAGPLGVYVDSRGEVELYQRDLSWKYSIPLCDSPREVADYLSTLAAWLYKYENGKGER